MDKRYTITDDDGRHYIDMSDIDISNLDGRVYGPAIEQLAQYENDAAVEPMLAADHLRAVITKVKELRADYYHTMLESFAQIYRSRKWWQRKPKTSLWDEKMHALMAIDKVIELLEEYNKALAPFSTKENPD